MRVGVSVSSFYTKRRGSKNIDGIGTYTANLCQALKGQNVQIEEIYFNTLKESIQKQASKEENFSEVANPILSLLPGAYYNNIRNKIDLLHITDYLVPRIKNTTTIATIHDAIMLKHPEWLGDSKRINYLKRYILKKLVKQADYVITCSKANIADIVNFWGIPEEKIAITYYGLSEIWHQKIDSLTQQNVLKKYQLNKPFFLTVGTLQPRKNIERMINAYLSLPKRISENFNLVIVGKEHAALTHRSVLEKIAQLEKTGHLLWLKYVPFEDLRAIYQSAYLLLYPSLAEGFGFPILEGFASAIPVITSNFGSSAEIAGKAAYLVDPYSEEAIATALIELTENSDRHAQCVQAGLSQVKQFNWEKCAKQTVEIYKKLI